ncbi:hypothetical protein [Amycolatopsis anabasis]|uniref:hypothetical protein n=1 Tax=Amycolatopsis anabasis TaxID=1840409 RepID=UPI00131C0CE7|nr:hypothetical protein [Amycolatopsis anabasis]
MLNQLGVYPTKSASFRHDNRRCASRRANSRLNAPALSCRTITTFGYFSTACAIDPAVSATSGAIFRNIVVDLPCSFSL